MVSRTVSVLTAGQKPCATGPATGGARKIIPPANRKSSSTPPLQNTTRGHWLFHRSPLYLHCKLYALTALVSLFVARPFTDTHDGILRRAQHWVDEGRRRRGLPVSEQLAQVKRRIEEVKEQFEEVQHLLRSGTAVNEIRDKLAQRATFKRPSKIKVILHRWRMRIKDLAQVSNIERAAWTNTARYPEIQRKATVRLGHQHPSPGDDFIRARRRHMLPHFQHTLSTPHLGPSDLPLIGVGGSGGGFRAMLGYAAFLHGLQTTGLWNLLAWTSGVSGSCWTLASLYTHCQLSTDTLLEHYRRVTSEQIHPMSMQAFDLVARSRRGNAFLFGPLLRKTRLLGHRGGGSIMDLYATLTTSYLMLPRHEQTHTSPSTQGLSHSAMSWARVSDLARLHEGAEPLPVLTAVRVALDEQAIHQNQQIDHLGASLPLSTQWWDFTPFEVGTADAQRRHHPRDASSSSRGAFVPAWSFGRHFQNGMSTHDAPEIPLSLILGHCTSAPAGPLTGYISALLATLPRGTIMSWALNKFNSFLLWKVWRKRWANPIRSSKEWNPFFGLDIGRDATAVSTQPPLPAPATSEPASTPGQATPQAAQVEAQAQAQYQQRSSRSPLDTQRKIKLMDAGVSNNLPSHVFHTSHRRADIFLAFDASSDVQSPTVLNRVLHFGRDRGLRFWIAEESKDLLDVPGNPGTQNHTTMSLERYLSHQRSNSYHVTSADSTMQERFGPYYCVVLDGYSGVHDDDDDARPHNRPPDRPPDLTYIYCPLLPHVSNPSFDPATAHFSTSYNLIWETQQAEAVFKTVQGCVVGHVAEKVKRVIKRRTHDAIQM